MAINHYMPIDRPDSEHAQDRKRRSAPAKQRLGLSSRAYAIFKYGIETVEVNGQKVPKLDKDGNIIPRKPVFKSGSDGSVKRDKLRSELSWNDTPKIQDDGSVPEKVKSGKVTKYGVPTNQGTFIAYGPRTKTGKLVDDGKKKSTFRHPNGEKRIPANGHLRDAYEDAVVATGRNPRITKQGHSYGKGTGDHRDGRDLGDAPIEYYNQKIYLRQKNGEIKYLGMRQICRNRNEAPVREVMVKEA